MILARAALLLALVGTLPAPASAAAGAAAASHVTAAAPVQNFRLPAFTAEGWRRAFLRAGEARVPDPSRVDVRDMDLTLYNGLADEAVEVRLTATAATFWPDKLFAEGSESFRLERGDLTLTGRGWNYDHTGRHVLIQHDAHLVFRLPLGDLLK